MKINKTEYGYFPCMVCGIEGLRYKDNPCNKCKRQSPQTKPYGGMADPSSNPPLKVASFSDVAGNSQELDKTADTNRIKEEEKT